MTFLILTLDQNPKEKPGMGISGSTNLKPSSLAEAQTNHFLHPVYNTI